jgi:hypothetical protein
MSGAEKNKWLWSSGFAGCKRTGIGRFNSKEEWSTNMHPSGKGHYSDLKTKYQPSSGILEPVLQLHIFGKD